MAYLLGHSHRALETINPNPSLHPTPEDDYQLEVFRDDMGKEGLDQNGVSFDNIYLSQIHRETEGANDSKRRQGA